MAEIAVGGAINEGFSLIRRNPGSVLLWGLARMALAGGVIALYAPVYFALYQAARSGAGPAAISEIFPTRSRSTWMTTGYALSVAIFGGFAPFIATLLIDVTGMPIAPVFYVMAASVITALVLLGLRETAHEQLG